jgi:hypothetical protein
MPYSIEFRPDATVLTFDPEATTEEIWQALRELRSHSSFKPGVCLLADDRGSKFMPEKSDMLALIDLFREMGFLAMALVVAHTHHYGMARQMEVFAEEAGYQVRVFRNRGEAEAWIEAATPSST